MRLSIIIVRFLVVICPSGCGKREFKEFISVDGRFKVVMPGTPTEKAHNAGGILTKNYIFAESNGAFAASHTDGIIEDPNPEEVLNLIQQAALSNRNAVLTKETSVKFAEKYPGRYIEATLQEPQGGFFAFR